jgi:hypothetical protein
VDLFAVDIFPAGQNSKGRTKWVKLIWSFHSLLTLVLDPNVLVVLLKKLAVSDPALRPSGSEALTEFDIAIQQTETSYLTYRKNPTRPSFIILNLVSLRVKWCTFSGKRGRIILVGVMYSPLLICSWK